MSLTHLWPIYLGAAALALPLVVHLLTRPRPRALGISTLKFLREVLQQRRAANRLRDFLVLALRTLAIGLLALALARPLLENQPAPTQGTDEQLSRAIVLDVSQSMGAGEGAIKQFERARARAAELLEYQPGLRANLILAGAAPRPVFEQFSTNLPSLRDALERSRVEPQRLNLQAALGEAAAILAAAAAGPQERRELYVISDMQRSNSGAPDFAVLPAGTEIHLESVAAAKPLANLAVLRAGLTGTPSQGKSARLEIEVGNYAAAARQVTCEVTLGDAVYRLGGACAGRRQARARPGGSAGECRLADRHGPADRRRQRAARRRRAGLRRRSPSDSRLCADHPPGARGSQFLELLSRAGIVAARRSQSGGDCPDRSRRSATIGFRSAGGGPIAGCRSPRQAAARCPAFAGDRRAPRPCALLPGGRSGRRGQSQATGRAVRRQLAAAGGVAPPAAGSAGRTCFWRR